MTISGEAAKTASGKIIVYGSDMSYLVNLPDGAMIFDAQTMKPTTLHEVRNRSNVVAYVSKAMTKTEIPQTNAIVLLSNVPEGYRAPAYAAILKELEKINAYALLEGKAEKTDTNFLRVTADGQVYMVSLAKAMLFDVQNFKQITAADIKDGENVAAYVSSVMTDSLPPQTMGVVILANLPAGFKAPSVEQALEYVENMQNPPTQESEDPVYVWGSVQEKNGNRLELMNSVENDPLNHIILNVAKETIILDSVTGEPKTIDDIEEGEIVYGYIKPALALSNPPQATPIILLCDIPADFGVPAYYVIDSVELTGAIAQVKTTSGETLSVSADVELVSYRTNNIPNLTSIKAGTPILVWTNMRDAVYKVMLF